MKIEDMGLSVRAYNVLKRARIDTVEQLQQLSDDDLLCLRNMSAGTVREIREKVAYVKTMTNADRIRAMSDRELANLLAMKFADLQVDANGLQMTATQLSVLQHTWFRAWMQWLQQPAEDL